MSEEQLPDRLDEVNALKEELKKLEKLKESVESKEAEIIGSVTKILCYAPPREARDRGDFRSNILASWYRWVKEAGGFDKVFARGALPSDSEFRECVFRNTPTRIRDAEERNLQKYCRAMGLGRLVRKK